MKQGKILLADDEPRLRELYTRLLELEGYDVKAVDTGRKALVELDRQDYLLCLLDVRLPDANGVPLTADIKKAHPDTEVILLTAYGTIADGVKAMQNGAMNYLTKGDTDDQLIPAVEQALHKARLARLASSLERQHQRITFDSLVGSAPLFAQAVQLARRAAEKDVSILLTGESGTGKEWFAQAIHQGSPRSRNSFVAVNCAAIPHDMLESELFGHTKGAFTGALAAKKGWVALADGGTLFLDEIGELPLDLQAKLLRLLETGEYHALGDPAARHASFRLVCATNRQLEQQVEAGRFRADLYYRIAVFGIPLPALRERLEDIPALVQHFVATLGPKLNPGVQGASPKVLAVLATYAWPGNLRELRNAVERALILAEGPLLEPADFSGLKPETGGPQPATPTLNLAELERQAIQLALARTSGNKTRAAELLGIAPSTLYRKLEEYMLG